MSERYPDGFAWASSTKRYRNVATGRFIKGSTIQRLRDQFIAENQGIVRDLTTSLADGTRSTRQWESEVWTRIEIVFNAEFMAARGGRNALTDSDRNALARMLSSQRSYLRNFAEEIQRGTLSEAMIQARVKLYLNSARQAFEHGKASAWNIVLPAYPADGSSECGANDRCWWEISGDSVRIEAHWRLSVAEHCGDCQDRASRWNPYVILK
jgi:hypothetical protein